MADGWHRACRVSDIPAGGRVIVDVEGISIGIFEVDGSYHALLNRCPHAGAPLCRGRVTGRFEADAPGQVRLLDEGHVLRCPWHGWEFEIPTGRSLFNPHRVRARSFPVSVEDLRAASIDEVESFPTDVGGGWITVQLRGRRSA